MSYRSNSHARISFQGGAETLSEAHSMLRAVESDLHKETDPELKYDLESLGEWLRDRIDPQTINHN